MQIGTVTFNKISNVRKSGNEEGIYFADVQLSVSEGFPYETSLYCARVDDYAPTGRWVYQQILEGNFEGDITQLAPNVDPITGKPYPIIKQSAAEGAQTL